MFLSVPGNHVEVSKWKATKFQKVACFFGSHKHQYMDQSYTVTFKGRRPKGWEQRSILGPCYYCGYKPEEI